MQVEPDDKRVETKSGLGKAYKYMLKRWDKPTLFLRSYEVDSISSSISQSRQIAAPARFDLARLAPRRASAVSRR
jgi:hypothetical protein